MSSQFSYELDERQVRLLMQDAESEYNESLWNKFDELATIESKSAIDISNYVPKFNLSISRSIVVPVMFIILIGGLSAMLFSFVDFKKKESIDEEIPLVANPENFKKPEINLVKSVKAIEVKTKPITKTTVSPSTIIAEPAKNIVVEERVKKLKPEKVLEITNIEVAKPVVTEIKKETSVQPLKKKKKKNKVTTEELPTIKAVTNLNEGVSEPELDLK